MYITCQPLVGVIRKLVAPRTLLHGSLRHGQDDRSGGYYRRGLGNGETKAVVDLLHGIAARRDESGLAGVVALQDEHPAQVVVQARASTLYEKAQPLRDFELLLGKPVDLRVILVDLLRDLFVLRA